MPLYGAFYPETVKTIEEALDFVKKRIKQFASEKKKSVDKSHHAVIDEDCREEIFLLDGAEEILTESASGYGSYELDVATNERFLDIIRSALEIYLRDTLNAKAKTDLPGFDAKIQEIRRITSLEGLKTRKTVLFDKYYPVSIETFEGKKIEIFFSYAHEDKVLAGKIADYLVKREIDVFLAHEDIEVSTEWRKEILKHLENDNILIALLTASYEESVWANQEAGYMIGKRGKTIPLIVGETDIKKFGFLESYQGIPVKEDDLEDCIKRIMNIVLK